MSIVISPGMDTRLLSRLILAFVLLGTACTTTLANDEVSKAAIGAEESPPKDLLSTREGVLLGSREIELSIGFSYEKRDSFESLRQVRQRQLEIPVTASIGISKKLNLFFVIPLIYRLEEQLTIEDTDTNTIYGIGDILTGLNIQLIDENTDRPNVSTSLSLSVPSGKQFGSSDEQAELFNSDSYGGAIQINVSKTVDPAVLNFGLGYGENFTDTRLSADFQPGRTFNYSVGAGFSVNSALLFDARMSGSYLTQARLDDDPLPGSSSEPVSMDMSISYRLNRRGRLESGVSFGLNEDAEDASISIAYVWSRRPG